MDNELDSRVTLGVIHADLKNMKEALIEIKQIIASFKSEYITKEEFAPVKAIVYALVGLVMTGFVLALIALVIKA
jgi:hypothetical protein